MWATLFLYQYCRTDFIDLQIISGQPSVSIVVVKSRKGSYLCECNEGFYKDENTRVKDTCININECDGSAFDNATAIHNCDKNADCIDTIG